ncbi:MAG: helix-turn-helix transcriptional regulator [Limisphaerales bacterium]
MKCPAPSASSRKTRPPLERMMRIHQALQSGTFPNLSRLSKDLEVSTKSIQRDLDFMKDRLNLPIQYHEQRWGYGYTEEVRAFPTLQITEGELFALLVAEKAVQQYRGTSFEQPLLSALKKMAASLPDTVSLHLADWDQTISFRTSAEPILNLEIFDTLARATAGRQQLSIAYRKAGDPAPETRIVDPYHLANINGEWYLFAHDHLRGDIRTFVPARIQSAQPTGKAFPRPPHFSVDQQLRDSFGVHSGDGCHEVLIRFSSKVAGYIREKRWHPSQNLRELPGGGVDLQVRLSSLSEIQRWILGWGGEAVAIQPPELSAAIRQAAEQLLRNGQAHESALKNL